MINDMSIHHVGSKNCSSQALPFTRSELERHVVPLLLIHEDYVGSSAHWILELFSILSWVQTSTPTE